MTFSKKNKKTVKRVLANHSVTDAEDSEQLPDDVPVASVSQCKKPKQRTKHHKAIAAY